MLRRIGRDRRFPPTARPWGIEFARKYSLDWAVDASLNVTLGTSPDLSLVGDLVAANDATATAGNPSVWVPADPNFGARSVIASRSERLDAGYGGLSGAAAASVLVVGRPLVNGYLIGSDNFAAGAGWALYHTGTTIVVYLDGTANYATYNCDGFDAAAYELQYDDSQAAWARLKVFRDGTELSPASTVGTCPTAFPAHSSIVLGGAAATLEINCTVAFAGAAAKLVPGVAATAELAARFADSFWYSGSFGGHAVGRSFRQNAPASTWLNCSFRSVSSEAGDCVAFAKALTLGGHVIFGLDESMPTNYTNLAQGLYFNAGLVWTYENGAGTSGLGSYTLADYFEVRRVGTTVSYYKNGVLLRTSLNPLAGDVYFAGVILEPGAGPTECAFGSSVTPSWEDTHAATFGINAALYTADSAHVLEAADSYVERLASWVGNTPAERIAGVQPPTRVASVAALGGRPGLMFSTGSKLNVSPSATLLSSASQFCIEICHTAITGFQYLLSFDSIDLAVVSNSGNMTVYIGSTGNSVSYSVPGDRRLLLAYDIALSGLDRLEVWENGSKLTRAYGSGTLVVPAITTGHVGGNTAAGGSLDAAITHLSFSSAFPADPAAQSAALYARYL